jgi:hypothetical protein
VNLQNSGVQFDIVASTGRTATTYLSTMIDSFTGVTGCHEGYPGSEKLTDKPIFPLINLENAAAFQSPATAKDVVATMRGAAEIKRAGALTGNSQIVDVAYYNAMICTEILRQNTSARLVGIIRNCEDFVRSSTTLSGTDPLPVGWPDPDKPLSDREAFIGMGRIRPGRKSPDRAAWKTWSAIERNIWLWRETNLRILETKDLFPARTTLMRFETLQADRGAFISYLCRFLGLNKEEQPDTEHDKASVNKKPFGYQVGPATDWTSGEIAALEQAQTQIDESATYDC